MTRKNRKIYLMGTGKTPRGVNPDHDTNTVTEGVATTGQLSPRGTVTHTEHWDGHIDATVTPRPIHMTTRMERPGT